MTPISKYTAGSGELTPHFMSLKFMFGMPGIDASPGFCPGLHGPNHFPSITVEASRMPCNGTLLPEARFRQRNFLTFREGSLGRARLQTCEEAAATIE